MTDTRLLPVLPLDDDVVLPGMVVPLDLTDAETRAAVESAQAKTPSTASFPGIHSGAAAKAEVLIVPRVHGEYAELGTVATVERVGRIPGGKAAVLLRGTGRAVVGRIADGPGAARWVHADDAAETTDDRSAKLAAEYKAVVISVLQQRGGWQMIDAVQQIEEPSAVADLSGNAPYLNTEQKIELLNALDVSARLEKALEWSRAYLAELEVTDTIRKDVADGMEKQQKEFLLRRQLEAIRKELGELDGTAEDDDYRARVEAAELPDNVKKAALAEVDKLERTSEQSPEGGWIRTWLDTVLELPWNERTEDVYDIAAARAVLDADHAGLDDVKERIIEYLAVASVARNRVSARSADGVEAGQRKAPLRVVVGEGPALCSRSRALPGSARPRWASPSRGPWAASSSGSRWAGSGMRRRSAGTGARTSARCPAASCGPSRRPAR